MHCITTPPAPTYSKTQDCIVHQVPAHKDNVIWLIEYARGLCAVVDGPSAKEVLPYIQTNNLRITHILNTHTHGDHVGINRDLGKRGLLDDVEVVGCRTRSNDIPHITSGVDEGDVFKLGDLDVTVYKLKDTLTDTYPLSLPILSLWRYDVLAEDAGTCLTYLRRRCMRPCNGWQVCRLKPLSARLTSIQRTTFVCDVCRV